ncbi:uncharacterized protein P174DRAFT_53834 [Aspergillus novofumigatus IBT 16806]|uniref:Uncharacterized protein n=1 Tax=Aspergillus novofumigatus (strain IBT 16806) TaxID=1392255 RepID=A0A2I1BUS4_ASPN1|nr:uncharacterized protein P174DRAFT_53834 [Aspergillus novofumigatus IBT 16806]PKX89138.1 hypothetical protein P174DRAFT_53834 [Aspergillus novofumigatus IBT 16806]
MTRSRPSVGVVRSWPGARALGRSWTSAPSPLSLASMATGARGMTSMPAEDGLCETVAESTWKVTLCTFGPG